MPDEFSSAPRATALLGPRLSLWQRALSVRHLVAGLTLVFLVAAGTAAIALVVPAAIARLRSLAEEQAGLLADDALARVLDLYAAPTQQLDVMTNLTREAPGDAWAWPSSSAAAHRAAATMHNRAVASIALSDPEREFFLFTGYLDNVIFAVGVNEPGGTHSSASQCVEFTGGREPWVPSHINVSETAIFRQETRFTTYLGHSSRSRGSLPRLAPCFDDDATSTVAVGRHSIDIYAVQQFFGLPAAPATFFAGFTGGGLSANSVAVASYQHGNETIPVFVVASPLRYHPPHSAPTVFVGITLIATSFRSLQRNLCALSSTSIPGWRAITVSRLGDIFATSSDCGVEERLGEALPRMPANPAADGRRCHYTFEIDATLASRTDRGVYCVPTIDLSKDPVERALAPLVLATAASFRTLRAARLTLAGESYYVSLAYAEIGRYGTAEGQPRVVTVVPEAAITGAVLRANYAAVGVAVGCTVVSGLAAAALIAALLRSLPVIARGMADAALMQDPSGADGEGPRRSCFGELDGLENAAALMHAELREMRAYVPASVRYRVAWGADAGACRGDGASSAPGSSARHSSRRSGQPYLSDEPGPDQRDGRRSAAPSLRPSRSSSRGSSDGNFTEHGGCRRSGSSRKDGRKDGGALQPSRLGRRLERRRVSVVVAHAFGVADAMLGMGDTAKVTKAAADLVRIVTAGARWHGGVLLHTDGDTFTVTFNAARPCGPHATQACRFAQWLSGALQTVASGVRAGVATGPCLVGNLGSAGAKAFSVVGPAAEHARVLERLAALYGEGCFGLVSQGTLEAAERSVALGTVDLLCLPTGQLTTTTTTTTTRKTTTPAAAPRLQRVAAILKAELPWHDAGAAGASVEAAGVDSMASSVVELDFEKGEAAARHAEEVAGWLEMGATQSSSSPLWRWNEACRLLAQDAGAAAVAEASQRAIELRPSKHAGHPRATTNAKADKSRRSSGLYLRVRAAAHVPRLMAANRIDPWCTPATPRRCVGSRHVTCQRSWWQSAGVIDAAATSRASRPSQALRAWVAYVHAHPVPQRLSAVAVRQPRRFDSSLRPASQRRDVATAVVAMLPTAVDDMPGFVVEGGAARAPTLKPFPSLGPTPPNSGAVPPSAAARTMAAGRHIPLRTAHRVAPS